MANGAPLLICYDGSEGARAAVETAGGLFGVRRAVVACFWQPFAARNRRFAVDILELVQNAAAINEREEQLCHEIAEEGSAMARESGLLAEPCAIRIDGPIDEAIVAHADEIDAAAIVLGAGGRSTLRSLLIGAVANGIVQQATRPVLLVPSARLASRRHEQLTFEARAR
jgi:nucleotide-binding universal stress UspA family protein